MGAGRSFIRATTFTDPSSRALPDLADALSDISDDETLDEYLAECRTSLLAGLKRHFHFKSAEGLLSKGSLRLLDFACDAALSRPHKPLNLWKEVRVWLNGCDGAAGGLLAGLLLECGGGSSLG